MEDLHRASRSGEPITMHRAQPRHVSPLRFAGALLMLLMLTLAACASDNGDQAALAKSQVFIYPYLNGSALNIGGVTDKAHDAVLDPAALSLAADSATSNMLYS